MKTKTNNLSTIFFAIFVGSMLLLSSFGNSASAASNPYTKQCPGNKVKYGSPKGKTATAAMRKKVFGNPYPNANVAKTTFMDKEVYVNKKIIPCLKAVEWDLKYKYKTNYRLRTIGGSSEVNSQNPKHYFHPYGGAVDINASDNPYYPNCKKRKDCSGYGIPNSWVKAFRAHGFFWGGDYKDSKDYMHFEWHGQK